VADVPVGVVTVISTVAATSAGEIAVIFVSELTTKLTAATVPNFTVVAPVKPLPLIVTPVPPLVVPEVGLTLVMAGTAAAE
jgi:hypothetical protein